MKIKNVLSEIFDINLFKRNIANAMSTIKSEMDNVHANMAEKDEAIKKKEEENENLRKNTQALNTRLKTSLTPKTQTQSSGVGTTKSIVSKSVGGQPQ